MFNKEINEILKLAGIKLNESIFDDRIFYTKNISKLLKIGLNIGNARFIYIPDNKLFVIGLAKENTHLGLLCCAIEAEKINIPGLPIYDKNFDVNAYLDDVVDKWYQSNIEGVEYTGAIISKKYLNNKNVWKECPDSTAFIFDFGEFYLCNGDCIFNELKQQINSNPIPIKSGEWWDRY